MIRRTFWLAPWLESPEATRGDDEGGSFESRFEATSYRRKTVEAEANLIGSMMEENRELHAPVLDIDFEAKLVPSSTEGHHHLYLDKPLTWEEYAKLLTVLGEVGILEPAYVSASLRRGQTFVRKPSIKKAPGAADSAVVA